MLAEIRERSQITIPAEIMKRLGAKKGDLLEVIERDGGIFLCPVVVYPKTDLERIERLIHEAEEQGDSKSYKNVESMFADMGIELNDVQN